MLGQRRRRRTSFGPALGQRLVFAGSVDKPHCVSHIGVVPKRNNKSITVHKSHLITSITKAIDTTTSISYQPLWLCCWRGDISCFFVYKKTVTLLVIIIVNIIIIYYYYYYYKHDYAPMFATPQSTRYGYDRCRPASMGFKAVVGPALDFRPTL